MFEWSQYLELAHRLSDHAEEESLRSAVSRAYYAAFCSCRNWLYSYETNVDLSQTSSANWEVAQIFRQCKDIRRRRIGRLLHQLRRVRNQADYDDRFPDLSEVAEEALKHAEVILSLLITLVPPKD